jgi:hypothetical protein
MFSLRTLFGLVVTFLLLGQAEAMAQTYVYDVKFVCGKQGAIDDLRFPVTSGFYATDINIHNPYPNQETQLVKHVTVLFLEEQPLGREPRTVPFMAQDSVILNPWHSTFDDCLRIREILGLPPADLELLIGFFHLRSRIPLTVDAVYTSAMPEMSPTIEVERISPKRM